MTDDMSHYSTSVKQKDTEINRTQHTPPIQQKCESDDNMISYGKSQNTTSNNTATILGRTLFLHACVSLASLYYGYGGTALAHSSAGSLSSSSRPPVVISGAGPAGLFFAQCYLEKQQQQQQAVYILESKPSSSSSSPSAYDLAFGFGIGERARSVLQRTAHGSELVEAVGSIAAKTPSGMWMVNRADLCRVLTEHLQTTCGKQVHILYDSQVVGIEKNDQGELCAVVVVPSTTTTTNATTTCESSLKSNKEDSERQLIPYSLLVAADGTHSNIREDLVQKGLLRQKRYLRPVRWKALQLPPQDPQNMKPGVFLPYPPPTFLEFGAVMPRHPDRFVALLFWKSASQKNPFGDSQTPQELKEAMTRKFPNITTFPKEEELAAFLETDPGNEYYMKLNRHAVPELQVALLGDAASGVYSRLGQGCASALASSHLLAHELSSSMTDEHHTSLNLSSEEQQQQALKRFSSQSKKQGHALADLNLLSHIEYSRVLGPLRLYSFMQLARKINDVSWSYSDILQKYRWQVAVAKMDWRLTRRRVRD